MRVYLTGATGFVGSYVLRALLAEGHEVRCLLRDRDATLHVEDESGIKRVKGDITVPRSLAGTMQGCDAVIHLVGIIKETPDKGVTFKAIHEQGSRHVIDEAREAGIRRFVLMSANGARENGVSAYQTTKWAAETYLKSAGFDRWTIFRPSVIFGRPAEGQPEFASQLVRDLVRPFPILPVFGDGTYALQPVAVDDVAQGFTQALNRTEQGGRTYCMAGPEPITYLKTLDILCEAIGVAPKPKLHQPTWLVRPVVQTLGRFDVLPITPDQFEMLLDGNTCSPRAFYRDFDVSATPFVPEHLSYLQSA